MWLAFACLLLLPSCVKTAAGPARKAATPDLRLVVVVSVDQLRPDRIDADMPGGLGRFLREGRSFPEAALEHAFTETCPGHSVMLAGRNPARVGIPSNSYVDPDTLEVRYCVEDHAPDAALVGLRGPGASEPTKPSDGRSPRILRVSGLGDWLKRERPGTRVFSVSGKDRAAIAMGGQHPDAAYWLARGPAPAWVTSRYYQKELPAWVAAWDVDAALASLPANWRYLSEVDAAMAPGPRPDDYAHELPLLSRTQPHPLRQDPPNVAQLPEAARHVADRLYVTPFADDLTLAFARDLVVQEGLGSRAGAPDLLAISLSSTDLVGHFYGPESWESRDGITRLDRTLDAFLGFLDETLGEGRWVGVLTADHGVLPVPEWIQEQGRSGCPVPGGRVDPSPLAAQLEEVLDEALPGLGSVAPQAPWFREKGGRLTLNRELTGGDQELEARVLALAIAFFEDHPGIERVWTKSEVMAGNGPEPMATFYRNSWVPEISGDLVLQVTEDCLLGGRRLATSHGSPYLYDRAVPLVFLGPGIEPGRIFDRSAAPIDIAPTLADYLELPAPLGLDGQVLPLRTLPPELGDAE